MNVEIRWQKKLEKKRRVNLNPRTKKVRRSELSERYIMKLLFRQNNRKFKDEYLKKLERNWQRWKSVSPEEKNLERELMSELQIVDSILF